MKVTVTEIASAKLQEYGVGQDGKFLRVTVKPGGCSGYKYDAFIDEERGQDDQVIFEDGKLTILTDQYSALFLNGLEIDFSDDFIRGGFRLTNRQTVGSCGCGASFTPQEETAQ